MTANALRGLAAEHGDENAFAYPGSASPRTAGVPQFCVRARGPFRWAALGRPGRHPRHDAAILEMFGETGVGGPLYPPGGREGALPGPAGAHLLGWATEKARPRRGPIDEMVASGEWRGPIVIGRDLLDAGRLASPERETEGHARRLGCGGRLAGAKAMLNTRPAPELGLLPPRGRGGHGQVADAGEARWLDGSAAAASASGLHPAADPGLGVARHVDAGHPEAIDAARRLGVRAAHVDGADG